ncbi:hypothetical protein DIJ64_04945 [Mycobacterium leprae]|uniref:Uncharacterized protein n=1 Tax=Mycobacterium leprae TaxID=1769 RepID=A0AAD0P7P6_MYCLR|nr:hypothetical protein DIJ64_04945 [Mycobacterium leprae]
MRGGHHSSSSVVGLNLPWLVWAPWWVWVPPGGVSTWQTINLNHRLRVMSSSSV